MKKKLQKATVKAVLSFMYLAQQKSTQGAMILYDSSKRVMRRGKAKC